MRLITNGDKDVVAITMEIDADDDLVVKANGVSLLWIFKQGAIHINAHTPDVAVLKAMGFKVNDLSGKLAVCF